MDSVVSEPWATMVVERSVVMDPEEEEVLGYMVTTLAVMDPDMVVVGMEVVDMEVVGTEAAGTEEAGTEEAGTEAGQDWEEKDVLDSVSNYKNVF